MDQISSILKTGLLVTTLALALPGAVSAQTPAPVQDDKTYDFGLIPIGTVVHHTFVLKNTGKNPLDIVKITASCGCTTIESYPKQIAPGEKGEIVAVMNHQHTGYTDIAINVQTGPTLQDLYAFHLIGVLVDQLSANGVINPALVEAKDVMALQKSGKPVTLVDVRSLNLFIQSHAQGSQNVTPFALEGRTDLKKQMVVLINDGIGDPALLARIDHLKTLGFKDLHLLAGGLRAWQAVNGPIEGTALPQSASLALLSSADFYGAQKTAGNWLVINIDSSSEAIPTAYPVMNLPLNSNPQVFAGNLAAMLSTQRTAPKVLVTSLRGDGYDRIEPALQAVKVNALVYYLQDGTDAYVAYARQQGAALASQKITLKNDQAFLASTHTVGQVVHGGGCASCGH